MLINLVWKSQFGFINTIKDYVEAFGKYSKNNIEITDWVNLRLDADIIVLHYSIIHTLLQTKLHAKLLNSYYFHLKNFKGKIVAIIQDEYYDVNEIRTFLNRINVHLILSCVPKEHHRTVYNTTPEAIIERVLTGYVPENKVFLKPQPIKDRKTLIFYRGKNLPFYYGKLGQWKKYIGIKMKEYCEKNNIKNVNIAWNEKDKLFGNEWINTMHSSKVTLATPSGLNVFHYDNTIIMKSNHYERQGLSYKRVEKLCNLQDGPIAMGQLSPKMFEAAMCGTVLVMYPGTYNGVFKKDIHYIELQPDFSNIEEVMEKINNDDLLQKMSDRTYKDIVKSGKYSYESFIKFFDKTVESLFTPNLYNLRLKFSSNSNTPRLGNIWRLNNLKQ